ncbi:MAG: CBS domain-containing protein [Campylobacterota bacterium]
MFAVYNNGSVGFRSTADNLYELKTTEAPGAPRMKPDDDTAIEDFTQKRKKNPTNKQEAVGIYKKIAKLNNQEEVYHVEDIMTTDSFYIYNDATLQEAYEVLKDKKVSNIPTVTSGKKISGLISKKIILNLILEDIDNAKLIMQRQIKDIFLPETITADPISDIRRVSKVMLDFKLDAMPVVNDNDILVGIVSKTDIIKAVSYLPKLKLWS